jgi:hypothetical protein
VDPNHFLYDAGLQRPAAIQLPSSRRTNSRVPQSGAAPAHPQVVLQTRPDLVGALSLFDTQRNLAHVHFPNSSFQPAVGSRLQVFVPGNSGAEQVGELEVLESFPGSANVRPVDGLEVLRLGRHAQVVATVR